MRKNNIVIITGANSGIGLATARYLLEKDYKVIGIDKNVNQTDFDIYKCDITNEQEVANVMEEIYKKESRIDYLINNAGFGISGAIEYTEINNVRKIFEVNVVALINMCKVAIPYMRNNGFGRIINISSVAAEIPIPFQACYTSTKSAVLSFSMALDQEVKDFNIRVSAVLPGDTKTNFTSARVKDDVEEDNFYKERIVQSIKRMEKDEQGGMSPTCVSKVIHKVMKKKRPPAMKTVGLSYKFIVLLSKVLPKSVMLFIVKKIYG